MKQSVLRDFKTGRRLVSISPNGGELPNARQITWLKNRPARCLLPFDARSGRSARDVSLSYGADTHPTLREVIRHDTIDGRRLQLMLESIMQVERCCVEAGMPPFSILFDEKLVFVDDDWHLLFVFVPLDGMTFRTQNSPLALLDVLGATGRLKLSDAAGRTLSTQVATFVNESAGAFSLNSYQAFLERACSIGAQNKRPARAVQPVQSPVTSQRAVTSGRGQTQGNGRGQVTPSQPLRSRGSSLSNEARPYELVRLRTGERFTLPANRIVVVGRSRCAVQLSDNPSISHQHATLRCTPQGVSLGDLGSRGGTSVRGRRLASGAEEIVPYGERFALADEQFYVYDTRDGTWNGGVR